MSTFNEQVSSTTQDQPNFTIHVRSYKPLDIGFPAPGLYQGRVFIILPHPDPTILSRFNPLGSSPPIIELNLTEPTSADELYAFMKRQVPMLVKASRQVSRPINKALSQHLKAKRQTGSVLGRDFSDPDNPLDMPPE